MKSLHIFILLILLLFGAFLNFLPHLDYNYPLHVDEWVHFQYANHLLEKGPQYFGDDKISLENGFHILIAILNSFGISYLIIFRFFSSIFILLIALSLFILTRKIFNTESALFSLLFLTLLQSTVSILGPMFLIPLSIGLVLIGAGIYLLEIKSPIFFLPLSALLIIHPPSALAYLLIINIRLLINRENIIKNLSFQALAFLIALPPYMPIFMQKGFETVDNLSFTMIINPIFIPRFLGYFTILLIGIGIYFSALKKRYDLISYTLAFIFLIFLFYKLKIEVFLPYARTLMYLFLIFALLFGYGCTELISLIKKKKVRILCVIFLLTLILTLNLPAKVNLTKSIYHIIDENDYRAFDYIKNKTEKDSIVLLDPWKANALTPIAERKVFSRIVQGPNSFYEERNRQINTFFSNNCSDMEFLKQNNVSILYGNCNGPNLWDLKEIHPHVYLFQSKEASLTK